VARRFKPNPHRQRRGIYRNQDALSVGVWDLETGDRLKSKPNTGNFLSPDGKRVARTEAAAIHLFEVESGKPIGVITSLTKPLILAIGADGHYRGSEGIEAEIVYVVRTEQAQEMLTPEEFARKYGWKNDPARVRFAP
jgi:hypothetical protein